MITPLTAPSRRHADAAAMPPVARHALLLFLRADTLALQLQDCR